MILKHSDNLSSTLQHKSMSAAGGQEITRMTIKTLKSLREDQSFDLFWMKVNQLMSLICQGKERDQEDLKREPLKVSIMNKRLLQTVLF